MSEVEIKNIWAEDLFTWFLNHITSSGGDGSGAIVCKNYHEAAGYFQEWYHGLYGRDAPHPLDAYDDCVNFHDENENFIFTNNINIKLFSHDYVFIVREDCMFGGRMAGDKRVLSHV
jgi:hypothetical protein